MRKDLLFSKVFKYTIIREGAIIGSNCDIRNFVYIDKGVSIGKNCKIMDGAKIYRGVKIGDEVFIGSNVVFTNDKYPTSDKIRDIKETWKIGDGVSIGANSVILPDVNIKKDAVIGAGAVVTKNVEENTVVAGNPAKFIRYRWENE